MNKNAAVRRKFRNTPIVVDGLRFDSKREATYWVGLSLRVKVGEVKDLERQVRFPLVVNGMKIGVYICDFRFKDDDGPHVVDVKNPLTAKLPVYRLKKKLMAALHGINVEEWL